MADLSLQGDGSIVVGVIICQGLIDDILLHVLMPAPLFCMSSPVTQYLNGLFNLHNPLMTKSMTLLIFVSAFSLLYMAFTYFSAFYSRIPNKLLTASSMIFITYYEINSFYLIIFLHRLNPLVNIYQLISYKNLEQKQI